MYAAQLATDARKNEKTNHLDHSSGCGDKVTTDVYIFRGMHSKERDPT